MFLNDRASSFSSSRASTSRSYSSATSFSDSCPPPLPTRQMTSSPRSVTRSFSTSDESSNIGYIYSLRVACVVCGSLKCLLMLSGYFRLICKTPLRPAYQVRPPRQGSNRPLPRLRHVWAFSTSPQRPTRPHRLILSVASPRSASPSRATSPMIRSCRESS